MAKNIPFNNSLTVKNLNIKASASSSMSNEDIMKNICKVISSTFQNMSISEYSYFHVSGECGVPGVSSGDYFGTIRGTSSSQNMMILSVRNPNVGLLRIWASCSNGSVVSYNFGTLT